MRTHHRNSIAKEIGSLRRSLRTLEESLRRFTPLLSAAMSVNGALKGKNRPRPRLSSKARASLILQGRYMGYMRQLKPSQKAKVRKVKEAMGVRAAIVRAKELAM